MKLLRSRQILLNSKIEFHNDNPCAQCTMSEIKKPKSAGSIIIS